MPIPTSPEIIVVVNLVLNVAMLLGVVLVALPSLRAVKAREEEIRRLEAERQVAEELIGFQRAQLAMLRPGAEVEA